MLRQKDMLRDFQKVKQAHRNFKSRHCFRISLIYIKRGFSFTRMDGVSRLRLVSKIAVPVVRRRELPSSSSSVCVYWDGLGLW